MTNFSTKLAIAGLGLLLSTSSLCVNQVSANELPVKHVTLSSAGLVQLHHEGQVEKSDTLEIAVPLDQVDDVLKSLVIMDKQGQLVSVSLPGKTPLEQNFKNLPFSAADLQETGSFLKTLQGVNVSIDSQGGDYEGRIVTVEEELTTTPEGETIRYRVVLLSDDGIVNLFLDDVRVIDIKDTAQKELYQQALNSIVEGKAKTNRTLTVALEGDKKRDVSYSYVVEAPLWKTAYRLVVPSTGETDGFIQGWGVLENMTGQDWDNVALTLTSGAPVTYQQALYESYYSERPTLPVEVFGKIMPRRDDGVVVSNYKKSSSRNMPRGMVQSKSASFTTNEMVEDSMMALSAAPEMMSGSMVKMGGQTKVSDDTAMIRFTLPQKISLKAGHSMMVPFINKNSAMDAVHVYQPDTHRDHPLASVSFNNDAGHALPPGIITLYDKAGYVGDAQMPIVADGDDRFISYALDTKTKINSQIKFDRQELSIKRVDGVLKVNVKQVEKTTYDLNAPKNETRHIILEKPKQAGWELTGTNIEKIEETKSHWRIHVKLEKAEEKTVTVLKSKTTLEILSLNNASPERLDRLSLMNMDDAAQKAFKILADKKRTLAKLQRDVSSYQQQIRSIENGQDRIRQNYKTVPAKSTLAARYLSQLEDQEDSLDNLRKSLDKARKEKRDVEEDFKDMLADIKI